jgi:hypothetical protein
VRNLISDLSYKRRFFFLSAITTAKTLLQICKYAVGQNMQFMKKIVRAKSLRIHLEFRHRKGIFGFFDFSFFQLSLT